jgi:hypothetical protein
MDFDSIKSRFAGRDWVSVCGERLDLELELLKVHIIDNGSYKNWVYIFDYKGNCIIWRSNKNRSLRAGAIVSMSATISYHLDETTAVPLGVKKTSIFRPSKFTVISTPKRDL